MGKAAGKMKKIKKIMIFAVIFFISCNLVYADDFEEYYQDYDEEFNLDDFEDDSESSGRVVLNADRVSFNDETGHASAEGNAVLTYQGTTIMAERIDYDADTQKVEAMPLPGEHVVLTHANRALRGDHLDYDLMSREGILSGAQTRLAAGEGVVYIYGNEINVIPWDLAEERGLVKGKSDEYLVQWKNVTLTTCALDHPHYRLESKTISFIPGRNVVAKRPRVYLGNTYLFTSPLDYVVQLKRRAVQYSFLPYFQHSDTRGTGGGITGTVGWETGSVSLGLAWADIAKFEWMLELYQEINDEFAILTGVEYSWDDLWDEKQWRPYASLIYEKNGWRALLNWKKNEYISDQKDSTYEYKGRLDRRPEFIVYSPWFNTSKNSWLNFNASYGSYREAIYNENGNVTARYGLGLHSYFEMPLGTSGVEFFSDSTGYVWFYDRNDADQETLRNFTGFRYEIGSFELGTAYERRYTWGESAMHWDQFRERERIHQKIRFPLGREIYTAVRGSYDLDESMIDEVIYSLQWVTDCMIWDLHYTNDRTSGGDDQIGLSLSVRAFPDSPASFGQKLNVDPFLRPKDLPKENKESK